MKPPKAAGVAGVSAWRASKPVEDPRKTAQPASPRVTTTVSGGDRKHMADTASTIPAAPAPGAQAPTSGTTGTLQS
ncbi:hypothetical protein [Tersicoccus sp. Bi-70]|uniref:hypothetical protein n=1 Tax=Tersicoccus sp. Bi-70 TaxID=1897634 RepID=UPI00117D05BC|nr:hypothetical protein [Tersicoccus sp. Bi-70]